MRLTGDKEKQKGEKYYVAPQWQLIWRKFRKHKVAMMAVPIIGFFYFLAIFCEFISPYDCLRYFSEYAYVPPQRIHFFDKEKGFQLRPFVYGLRQERNPITLRKIFTVDKTQKYPVYFFVRGETYKLWNLFESNLHLFGTKSGHLFLFGTDNIGRDLFSRSIYASRISLSIGLISIFLSFMLGIMLGGIAGYYGGTADAIIMRIVDLLTSVPTIPLWMALAAAVPQKWPIIKTYFAITVVLSILGWAELARAVRGKILALREEDFIIAAKITGATEVRILIRHLIPSFLSYIIVLLTLGIPRMILGETTLSFLGIGLRAPAVSWGVLLQNAQKVRVVAHQPWVLIPGLLVVVTVLMFNFLGDGLRDVADPYTR